MLSLVLIKTRNAPIPTMKNENPPNRILNRFFELNSVENKMQLPKAQSLNKAQRQPRPELYFPEFIN